MNLLNTAQTSEQPPSAANFAGNSIHTACFTTTNYITWIIDSGASDHMCAHKSLFSNLTLLPKSINVSLPTGHNIFITHVGSVPITHDIILHNVLYVPDFKLNLLSVPRLAAQLQCTISFSHSNCFLQALL